MMLQLRPELSFDEVRKILCRTASPLHNPDGTLVELRFQGAGAVNVLTAIKVLNQPPSAPAKQRSEK